MREILFRGKAVGSLKWVEGFYFREAGNFIKELPSAVSTETHMVYEDTVGQYTGLTDKNGNKIFEGDILGVGIVSGFVLYKNGCFVFRWKNNDKHRPDFYKDCILTNYGRFNELEAIGNIHDNKLEDFDNGN